MANEINLIAGSEAIKGLDSLIEKLNVAHNLILQASQDSLNLNKNLGGIKSPSDLNKNQVDNSKIIKSTKEVTEEMVRQRLEISNKTAAFKKSIQEETSAYAALNNSRTAAKKTLLDLIATEGTSQASIKKAQAEFDKLDKKVKSADHAAQDFTKSVGNYQSAFEGALEKLTSFGGGFGTVTRQAIGFVTQSKEVGEKLKGINDAVTGGAKNIANYASSLFTSSETTDVLSASTDIATVSTIGFQQAKTAATLTTDALIVSESSAIVATEALAIAEIEATAAAESLALASGGAAIGTVAMAVGEASAAVGGEALAVGAESAAAGVGLLDVALGILLSPITLVVAAVGLLVYIFKDFAPIVNPIKDAFSALGAVFSTIKQDIFDLVTGARSLSDIFSTFVGDVGDAATEAYNLGKATRELNKAMEKQEVTSSRTSTEIERQLLLGRDLSKSFSERNKHLQEAIDLEEEKSKAELKNAYESARIAGALPKL